MKFLCIQCDEPMTLECAEPPDDGGSIMAVFGCPSCASQVAMLTNPFETQLVQSLGVKIGPATDGVPTAGEEKASGCPFSSMFTQPADEPAGPTWSEGALARLERIPEFVRPMARQGIEHYARERGRTVIDDALMEEARGSVDA